MSRRGTRSRRLVVALETSTRAPSVAARLEDEVRSADLSGERAHASDLLPTLAELLADLGAAPGEIDLVLVGLGPGSYTGLRVGVATALGLARGTGAEALGLSSSEVLAWHALRPGERAWHLLDARGGALYATRLERSDDDVRVLAGPEAVALEEFEIDLVEGERLFADEAAREAARLTGALAARVETGERPHASALLELGSARAARGERTPLERLRPLYLRPFEARVRKR